ncbi:ARM repeat-containing protein [Stereum hirsutum FP-91666 SS1]|uniref:ARM repeat-containing protein n=1 Tax=Stereum hirsutum (strain FP-91666) TaxID=721885 RepID=UPI000440B1D6|nr:ARM repeat-containing protein [Stereum hirsutum FP-91666 SS1]EIM88549.1 ARM repeat-containing protein [Stereum hirsutum FP-91666 SS1]
MVKPTPPNERISPEGLYNVLCEAASQDPAKMQAASALLKDMLELPGCWNVLQEIAAQKTVPLPVRQLSALQFKNRALDHWRSRRQLTDEERTWIKARCMTLLQEEDDVISSCNELSIANIAHKEYPHNWPNLIPDLITLITTNLDKRLANPTVPDTQASLVLYRSLRALNAVLKRFHNIKFLTGIAIMKQLHLILSNYYVKCASMLSSALDVARLGDQSVTEIVMSTHLLLKAVARIAVWVWPRLNTSKDPLDAFKDWFMQLFQTLAGHVRAHFELRTTIMQTLRSSSTTPNPATGRNLGLYTRHILTLGKVFRRLEQLDATRFIALPTCDDLVAWYWNQVVQANAASELIADSPTAVFPVRFLVQGMVLFKDSLAQWSPTRKAGTNAATMPEDFVQRAVTLLVTNFMPLKPADLEGWMADPEEWVNSEEKEDEQWTFEIRPCAERVLMTLANQYRDFVTPMLAEAFRGIIAQPTVGMDAVIQKEAVYCAVGRCAHRLKDSIDFVQWLDVAMNEVRNPDPDYLIIKRRVAWLIGKWIGDNCAPLNDQRIWQILTYLLTDKGEGTEVIRLTTAGAIKDSLNSNTFDPTAFAPFLGSVLSELLKLLADTEIVESKLRVASALETVLESAGLQVTPFIADIASAFPPLWTATGDNFMVKNALLRIVAQLISAVKENSAPLSSIVVPLIQESFTPNNLAHLDEDVFKLWTTALRNTNTVGTVGSGGLIDLFPLLVSRIPLSVDIMGRITDLLESYYLLDGQTHYATNLFNAYVVTFPNVYSINTKGLLESLEMLFQLVPPSSYAEALHTSGLFAHILKEIMEDKADTTILTHDIYVMSRIAVPEPQTFLQLMAATSAKMNVPETQLWEDLLDQWWRRFDNMSEPRRRKLTAMGIAALVSTGRQEVMQRLPSEIFNIWLDVFGELKEAIQQKQEEALSGESTFLTLYWDEPPSNFYNDTEDMPEYGRRKSSWDNDPIRTAPLAAFIGARLQEATVACGGPQQLQVRYLGEADPTVLKQLQDEIAGK